MLTLIFNNFFEWVTVAFQAKAWFVYPLSKYWTLKNERKRKSWEEETLLNFHFCELIQFFSWRGFLKDLNFDVNHLVCCFGVRQGDVVINPFISFLTLQEPKYSLYINFECNQLNHCARNMILNSQRKLIFLYEFFQST